MEGKARRGRHGRDFAWLKIMRVTSCVNSAMMFSWASFRCAVLGGGIGGEQFAA